MNDNKEQQAFINGDEWQALAMNDNAGLRIKKNDCSRG